MAVHLAGECDAGQGSVLEEDGEGRKRSEFLSFVARAVISFDISEKK